MSFEPRLTSDERHAMEEFRKRHRTGVLALLFTDIVGSTKIKQQLGDAAGTQLIKKQHGLVREVLGSFDEAEEISTAGDSFFIVFVKPSDAVRFSLILQNRVAALAGETGAAPEVRIGVHMGEVFIEEDAEGALERDVLGIHVDAAARVMSLATGDQILLTRSVFDNARTILTGETLPGIEGLSWVNHGPYLLRGFDDPIELCEVGERGKASLRQPADSDAGKRAIVAGTEPVLGWRPALEQLVPGSEWMLDRNLGEGGFGEIWLARHRKTKERRVFKFCFRADRLRSLKREMTLFRIMREVLGSRPDIARVIEVQFEEAPYYLELEYAPGGDLADWIRTRGGFENVPLELRLEIVAQVATALAAAHSVGVIHKDVKPSNVLIEEHKDGSVQVRLTDFGIGALTDKAAPERAGVTATGFTETGGIGTDSSSRSGTRLYMAPELHAGRPPSIQSDIYSLGVLLYQLVVGDLMRPVATDWSHDIRDPLVRADLYACLAGNPGDRFAGAGELAERLRKMPQRQIAREKREAAARYAVRRRRLFRALAATTGIILLLALALGYGLYREQVQRYRADKAREDALEQGRATERALYYANIRLISDSIKERRFDQAHELLADCLPEHRNWEWGHLQYLCNRDLMTFSGHNAPIASVAISPDGTRLATAGFDGTVRVWYLNKPDRDPSVFSASRSPILAVAISPDGKYMATGNSDAAIRIWDLETGTLYLGFGVFHRLMHIDTHTAAVTALAFSSDGRYLASGSRDATAKIMDLKSALRIRTFSGDKAEVHALAFSPDGQTLVTGHIDRTVKLWSLESGEAIRTIETQCPTIESVAIAPDGKRLAVAGDTVVHLWDLESTTALPTLGQHANPISSVAFSPNGRLLATGSLDRTAKVWDVQTGQEWLSLEGHSGHVLAVDFGPDGRILATGSEDGTAKVWAVERPQDVVICTRESDSASSPSHANFIYALLARVGRVHGKSLVSMSPDGKQVVVVGPRSLDLWDAEVGRRFMTLETATGEVQSIRFSRDGKWLAVGTIDGTARVWDLQKGELARVLKGHAKSLTSVCFSRDGTRLATASWDRSARLWDLKSGRAIGTYGPTEGLRYSVVQGRLSCIAVSPDGRRLATGSEEGGIILWVVDGSSSATVLQAHEASVNSLAFSPDGRRLASGSLDNTAKIWDLESGQELLTLRGHSESVQSVEFSSDGERLVTAGADGLIKLWDSRTGRELLALRGGAGEMRSLAFAHGGYRLVAASTDGTVLLWPAFPWAMREYQPYASSPLAGQVEKYKRVYWNKRLAAERLAFPISSARRKTSASEFSPGVPIEVEIALHGASESASATVTEQVPEGWTIETISDGGQRHTNTIRWTIQPWTTTDVSLRYTVVPPRDAGPLPAIFENGQARADSGYPVLIEDTMLHASGVRLFQDGMYPDPSYDGCQDTHIILYAPDLSCGGCNYFEEGDWYGGRKDHKKALVQFDLSTVPSTFSLGRATLRLYEIGERRNKGRIPHVVYVARVLRPWSEGQNEFMDGETPQQGDATFNSARHGVEAWELPGAMGVTDVADAESSTTVGENWPGWVELDVTRSVRYFLENPAENHGWKISQDRKNGVKDDEIEYVLGAYMYDSSEATEPDLRPMLVLVPE